jgi:hypothetical protein
MDTANKNHYYPHASPAHNYSRPVAVCVHNDDHQIVIRQIIVLPMAYYCYCLSLRSRMSKRQSSTGQSFCIESDCSAACNVFQSGIVFGTGIGYTNITIDLIINTADTGKRLFLSGAGNAADSGKCSAAVCNSLIDNTFSK